MAIPEELWAVRGTASEIMRRSAVNAGIVHVWSKLAPANRAEAIEDIRNRTPMKTHGGVMLRTFLALHASQSEVRRLQNLLEMSESALNTRTEELLELQLENGQEVKW